MRPTHLIPVLLLGLAACDSTLNLEPTTAVSEERAITDAASARAALAGIYNALASTSYYGGDFVYFTDLSSDDTEHSGTYTTFADADLHVLRAENATIDDLWTVIYRAIGRANGFIARVPEVADLDAAERDQMLGEAYFIRALSYHNLVKLWGGVPLRTEPPVSVEDASQITRSSADDVYAQILDDLDTAEGLLSNETAALRASIGAVHALRSRVHLYRGDWLGVETAANAVLDLGYELAPNFVDLFDVEGAPTAEDIFRIAFTAQDYNLIGYYYLTRSNGGRYEVAPTDELVSLFDEADARFAWSIGVDGSGRTYGAKFRNPSGTEDVHVIRLGEVILSLAEALARQGGTRLEEAVDAYNRIRERAGLAPHTFGVDVTTQDEVLAEILLQRRLELAFEGDRFADMVRTGQADAAGIPETQQLYPIPQSEIDVAPGLVGQQNPGY